VTQPAVTMQIKALESSTFETALFRKRGKFLELTDQGSMLFNYAEKIFRVVDEMEHTLKGFTSSPMVLLSSHHPQLWQDTSCPDSFHATEEKFPGIKVSLEVGSSSEIAEGVAAFKYDLAIIGGSRFPAK